MLAPKLGPDYSTPFLAQLREAGFSWWATLPKHTGFYAALGVGLLMHTFPTYPEYMTSIIHPRLHSLKTINDTFAAKSGDGRFSDAEFWYRIGKQCQTDCSTVSQKAEIVQLIQSDGLIEFSYRDVYDRIARYFSACLCIYESNEGGIRTVEFCDRSVGSLALVVCLAVEQDGVSVLVHKDFGREVNQAGFPNYVTVAAREWQTPQLFASASQTVPVHIPEIDPGAVQQVLTNLVNALCCIVRSSVSTLAPDLSATQESLRAQVQNLLAIVEQRPELRRTIDVEKLQAIAQIEVAKNVRDQHTYLNCWQYPESGGLVDFHCHQFHVECLRLYVASNKVGFAPVCPLCSQPFSVEVLAYFPEFFPRVSSVPSSPALCCSKCKTPTSVVFLHGECSICFDCSKLSWYEMKCVSCLSPLTDNDYDHLKAFINRTR